MDVVEPTLLYIILEIHFFYEQDILCLCHIPFKRKIKNICISTSQKILTKSESENIIDLQLEILKAGCKSHQDL